MYKKGKIGIAIIMIIIIPIALLAIIWSSLFIFKYPHLKIWDRGMIEIDGYRVSKFTYNENQYYDFADTKNTIGFNVEFYNSAIHMEPYIAIFEKEDELQYASYGKDIRSVAGSVKFFEFENDPEQNVIFVETNKFIPAGPSDGWYYLKKGFQFPTINESKVSSVFISYESDSIMYRNEEKSSVADKIVIGERYYTKISESVYPELISCFIEHKDFSKLLPETAEKGLCKLAVQYENLPLAEEIVWYEIDSGEFIWIDGGTE